VFGYICVILASLAAGRSFAQPDGSYREFSGNVEQVRDWLMAECRRNAPGYYDKVGIEGSLRDEHLQRQACGQGMGGLRFGRGAYTIFYQHEDDIGEVVDTIGVSSVSYYGANAYTLIVTWLTRRATEEEGGAVKDEYADALLFKESPHGWIKVWSYVDPVGPKWNAIDHENPFEYPQFSPEEVNFIHDLWRDKLGPEFDRFVERMPDLPLKR
jgi:hypothetical protein